MVRTVIRFEVLSEDPLPEEWDMSDVAEWTAEGDMSGAVIEVMSEEVSPERMAELLVAQGSDPEFFGLVTSGTAPAEAGR